MTLFRLGYVAMSVHVKNASPSQTMTFKTFDKIADREAAIEKLERIAQSNVENCLRLVKHNKLHGIDFFRISSKLVPLATHDQLKGWDYVEGIEAELKKLGEFAKQNRMRIDFHPDHFVVLNTPKSETFKSSIEILKYHYRLLVGMELDPTHRCVLHLGGKYGNKEESLERFISNWGYVPKDIQKLVILENDDKTYNAEDILYVCEKLNIPMVFDLHHHLANHNEEDWIKDWGRMLSTWSHSTLPVKMHISSPKSEKEFRSHSDLIDPNLFMKFVKGVNGTTEQIDCMIEAKQKDEALFQLVEDLSSRSDIQMEDGASFSVKE